MVRELCCTEVRDGSTTPAGRNIGSCTWNIAFTITIQQQNMGVNMNQAPQQPSGYNHGQYALQNMAGGADAAMQNDQSLGADTNSL